MIFADTHTHLYLEEFDHDRLLSHSAHARPLARDVSQDRARARFRVHGP